MIHFSADEIEELKPPFWGGNSRESDVFGLIYFSVDEIEELKSPLRGNSRESNALWLIYLNVDEIEELNPPLWGGTAEKVILTDLLQCRWDRRTGTPLLRGDSRESDFDWSTSVQMR